MSKYKIKYMSKRCERCENNGREIGDCTCYIDSMIGQIIAENESEILNNLMSKIPIIFPSDLPKNQKKSI